MRRGTRCIVRTMYTRRVNLKEIALGGCGFDAVFVFVGRGADVGGHWVGFDEIVFTGFDEGVQLLGFVVGIEPGGFVVFGEDHGHAIVEGFHDGVGGGGDNREGV